MYVCLVVDVLSCTRIVVLLLPDDPCGEGARPREGGREGGREEGPPILAFKYTLDCFRPCFVLLHWNVVGGRSGYFFGYLMLT